MLMEKELLYMLYIRLHSTGALERQMAKFETDPLQSFLLSSLEADHKTV